MKNRGGIETQGLTIEDSLYTLYWGFKKIPFTLDTYVLAKVLQNGAKLILKLTLSFKNHIRNLNNFRSSGKPKKLKFDGLLLCKKIHSFS